MPMPVSTWVEVDLDRFAANLRAVREHAARTRDGAGPPEILLVVKADAYGHGAVDMADAGAREGVAVLGVATLHEGIQLRQAGCALPIIVLSPLLPAEIDEAVGHQLDPTVCDLGFARAYSAAAERAGVPGRCHVEIDTGMAGSACAKTKPSRSCASWSACRDCGSRVSTPTSPTPMPRTSPSRTISAAVSGR